MPVKFSELVNKTKRITVNLGEMTVEVEYKINFYSPMTRDRVNNAEDPLKVQGEILAEAITWWDLVDDKGNMIPVSSDAFDKLGVWVANEVFTEMLKSARPTTAPTTKES
jgi:hypothetical protein